MLDQTEEGTREGYAYSDERVKANGHEQPSRYVVRLPVFEGPLDLLLHLIEKRQMEITTISLMAVTDQYLAYLQQWEEMTGQPGRAGQAGRPPGSPLHVARMGNMAAFVSIAARLLFIKLQSLLPTNS